MEQFVLGILVKNHFGVLTRVSALFARRGFNIDSLTVGETENPDYSRITVAARGDSYVKEQMMKQVSKLHDVERVAVMEVGEAVFRELLMLKVRTNPDTKQEIMDAVNVFRAKIIDYSLESLCVEMTGEISKIDAFVSLMSPFGILEMCRTGVVALQRGAKTM